MPVKSKAKVFDEAYNEQPGNDYAKRDADSVKWHENNTVEMAALGKYCGPQVGFPYDADALGEERAMITYSKGGKGVKPSTKRGG